MQVVGVIEDKLNDGLDKPVVPEAFIPETVYMRMGTQILVRSDVPPLMLLDAIRKQVSAMNADQQTNGNVRDLEHWAEGSSRDPLALAGVTVLLAAAAGLAYVIPARRASRIAPLEALRCE